MILKHPLWKSHIICPSKIFSSSFHFLCTLLSTTMNYIYKLLMCLANANLIWSILKINMCHKQQQSTGEGTINLSTHEILQKRSLQMETLLWGLTIINQHKKEVFTPNPCRLGNFFKINIQLSRFWRVFQKIILDRLGINSIINLILNWLIIDTQTQIQPNNQVKIQ